MSGAGKYLKYWYTVRQRIATNSIPIIVATRVYFDLKKVDKRSRSYITSPHDLVYPQSFILFTKIGKIVKNIFIKNEINPF